MIKDLYILTAKDGFVTATAATRDAIWGEYSRLNLALPITVVHWRAVIPVNPNYICPETGWKKVETFEWC